MVNIKKIIVFFFLIIVLVTTGVFFYWRNLQKELINLNEGLPEGIIITKTLMGDYEVINKIDSYSFKAPKSWEGIDYIEYLPEKTEENHTFTTINIEGKTKRYKTIGISKFQSNSEIKLLDQAVSLFNDFDLNYNFTQKTIKEIEIVKDDVGLAGIYAYIFQQENYIYVLVGASEEFIEEIIVNGKW